MIYEKIKEVGKHALVFGMGGMVNKVVAFLLLPLYTRLLTPSDYGTMELVNILLVFVLPWFACGLDIAIFRFYYEVKSDDDYRQLVGTAFTSILSISAVLTIILVSFRSNISDLLFGEAKYSEYFLYSFIAGFFNANKSVPLALFRAQKRSSRYSLYNIVTFILGMSLNILFLVGFRWGVLGIFRAQAIGAAISCMLLVIDRSRDISLRFSFSEFKRLFKFGMPIAPEGFLYVILTMSDRYIINYFGALSDVGVYAVGFKLATVLKLFFYAPLALIEAPIIFEVMNRPSARELYSKLLRYFFSGGVILALGLSLFSLEILKVMATQPFWSASTVVPLLCLGNIFYGCRVMVGPGLNIERKTYYFPIVMGIAAICNIVMNFVLIPLMGIIGAALATALASSMIFLLRYVISQKYYRVQFEWSRITGIFVLACLTLFVAAYFKMNSLSFSMIWKSSLFLLFLLAVNVSGIVDSAERKACMHILTEIRDFFLTRATIRRLP